MSYCVVRPDGSVIKSKQGINMIDALWNAASADERLASMVRKDATDNVKRAKRAGYSFIQKEEE